MKLNYKDTIQYKEDKKSFILLLGISIIYFMIFFLLFLGVFFFLKRESLEIASIVSLTGIFFYLLVDLPLIIKTVMVKHNMNLILKNMDDAYAFQIMFKDHTNHWFFQSKFTLSFKYKNETKELSTSWIYDSNNLSHSLVEVGYIESLNKIIVIKKY